MNFKSQFHVISKKFIQIFFSVLFVPAIIWAQMIDTPDQEISVNDSSIDGKENIAEEIPITLSDIPIVSTETLTQLDKIQLELKPVDGVKDIENSFIDFRNNISEMRKMLSTVDLGDLKFNRLLALQNSWNDEKNVIINWQKILQSRSQELDNFRKLLSNREKTWEITKENVLERDDPAALIARINEILDLIRDVDKALKSRQEEILTLMDQLGQESIQINKSLSQIVDAQRQTREHIFSSDNPPIWKAFKLEGTKLSFRKQIMQALVARISLFEEFLSENISRIIIQLTIFSMVLLFLLKIRKRGDLWIEENALESSFKYIYQYPLSSSLLITLVFTPFLYNNLHEFIKEFNRLLIIIPLIRVLPKIIYRDMRVPFLGLALLYLLQSVDELIIDFTLAHRLTLLLVTTTGLVFFLWNLRPRGPLVSRNEGNWWRAFVALIRLASLLFGLSILSNIFGNLILADLLTNAVLNIAYTGVVLLAAIRILENLIFIAFKTNLLSKLHVIKNNRQLIQQRVFTFLRMLALLFWIIFSLKNIDLYDPIKTFTQDFLSLSWQIGNISFTLVDILIFGVTIWLSVLISRFIRFVLEEDILPKMNLHRGVPASISIIIHYAVLAIGFLIALSAAGLEWSKFALLAGAFGVGIGFGLQNIVNNFISGLILIFERPIKVEDTIEVNLLRGKVKRIGIRSSTIRTFDGAEVIVPNGTLIQSEVTNWTLSDQLRRIEIKVGVSYESDLNQVVKILRNVAKEDPKVLDTPEPMVLFQGFGDSALDFSLRVWTSDFDNWLSISSDITLQVHDALKNAGIEIPFPQRDLHIRTFDKQTQDDLDVAK